MKTLVWLVVVVLLIGLASVFMHLTTAAPKATEPTSTSSSAQIEVASPIPNSQIISPVSVTGQARGGWYFEASAPVVAKDGNGNVLGQGHIMAQGEWMTTDLVPFTGSIDFATSTTATGTLVFMNDNPSGQASTSLSYSIPVSF